ncbi:MAG: tRNA threonylcarbamoyladenosine biosynthesis protein TsaE [Candidatus Midichloriaceae bacterium]|jgi:tRNA threonylcarbamoyladenosine biosynthesis protein TsaE
MNLVLDCSLEKLEVLVSSIVNDLDEFKIILLDGDLGTGKTTFVKHLIKSMGGALDIVSSPTFNLLHTYKVKNYNIAHFDLYRLNHESELYNIGLEEALDTCITIIEWSDLAKKFIDQNHIKISFEYSTEIDRRNIKIEYILNK